MRRDLLVPGLALALATLVPSIAAPAGARISPDFVRSVVRSHLSEVQGCYEEGLARRPELAGRIVVRWTVAMSGSVLDARVQSSTLGDPGVESCIVTAIRRWTFPANGRGTITVNYPFELRPAG